MKVVEEDAKQRLDKYVANKQENLSRMMVQKLIEEGNILVNGERKKISYLVEKDDEITITIPEVKQVDLKAQELPLDIVYEDNDIIVVNKAKGMVVHPAVRKSRWNFSKCHYGTLQGKFIWNRRRTKTRNCASLR